MTEAAADLAALIDDGTGHGFTKRCNAEESRAVRRPPS
jgi:hypothetical protein